MGKRDELIEKYAEDLRSKCGMEPDMALLTADSHSGAKMASGLLSSTGITSPLATVPPTTKLGT